MLLALVYTLRIFLRSRAFEQAVASIIASAMRGFEASPAGSEATASAIFKVLWQRAWTKPLGCITLGAIMLVLPAVLLFNPITAPPELWQSFVAESVLAIAYCLGLLSIPSHAYAPVARVVILAFVTIVTPTALAWSVIPGVSNAVKLSIMLFGSLLFIASRDISFRSNRLHRKTGLFLSILCAFFAAAYPTLMLEIGGSNWRETRSLGIKAVVYCTLIIASSLIVALFWAFSCTVLHLYWRDYQILSYCFICYQFDYRRRSWLLLMF